MYEWIKKIILFHSYERKVRKIRSLFLEGIGKLDLQCFHYISAKENKAVEIFSILRY